MIILFAATKFQIIDKLEVILADIYLVSWNNLDRIGSGGRDDSRHHEIDSSEDFSADKEEGVMFLERIPK